MTQSIIRAATVRDAATLADLAAALNAHFGMENAATLNGESLAAVMRGNDPLVFGYLGESDGTAIAYALCQKLFDTDTGTMATWLLDLYVEPAYRSDGLGRRLLARVASDAVQKGQRCVGLAVYENNPARRLYDRIGATLPTDALVYELRDDKLDKLAQEAQL